MRGKENAGLTMFDLEERELNCVTKMAERRASLRVEDAKRKREDDTNGASGASGDHGDEPVLRQNKRKWTRLLLRELYDLGYSDSAAALEHEARVQLRTDAMKQLQ